MEPVGYYRVMVDWTADGIWGTDVVEIIPDELLEKLSAWNWWWEMGLWNLERGTPLPDFNLEEFSREGLDLAKEVKRACPNTRVYYFDEDAHELHDALTAEFASTIIPFWCEVILEPIPSGSRLRTRDLPPAVPPWNDARS